ncbi:MAG: GPW/gp25 family protein [Pseudomonadota bacterium]
MIGASRNTGARLAGDLHLSQSISDILSTPLGSRVMRREYGSRLPDLIDAPMNPLTFIDVYQAVAEALNRWEPRVLLTRIRIEAAEPGAVELVMEGTYRGRIEDSGAVFQGTGAPRELP